MSMRAKANKKVKAKEEIEDENPSKYYLATNCI